MRAPEKTTAKERLAFLDILRFLAAAIVVVAHMYDTNVSWQGFQLIDLKKELPIFHTGVAGVIIFFLISGYIIPKTIPGCADMAVFMKKRALRIYPLLLVVMIYGVVRFHDFQPKMIGGLLLPVADFLPSVSLVKGVDWTLRVEFFYYLVLGILFFRGLFTFKTACWSIGLTSVLCVATYFYQELYFNYRLIYLNFIFLGALLYFIEAQNFSNTKNNVITALMAVLSLAVFELFRVDRIYLFPGLLFGTFCFLGLFFLHQTTHRIKSTRLTEFLGDLSYPSYLLHLMIYEDLFKLTGAHAATAFLFVLVCYGAHLLVEKPFASLARRRSV